MTKLEECARAVDCEAFLPSPIQKAGRADFEHQARQSRALHQAYAVIRCLMDVTEEMKTAGFDVNMKEACEGDPETRYPDGPAIFRAMLQAVLDEADTAPQIATSGHGAVWLHSA